MHHSWSKYLVLPWIWHITASVLLPSLNGPFKVGTTTLSLTDHARPDPWAPTPQPRALMITLFYPTPQNTKNHTIAPAFPPLTAAFLNKAFGVPPGTAESITTRAYLDAPNLRRPHPCRRESNVSAWPVVLFSPGFGVTRLEYSAQVSDLASRGFVVVAVDHPFDAPIVEYPDGRVAISNLTRPLWEFPGGIEGALGVRVKDLVFVLDALSNVSSTGSAIFGKGSSEAGDGEGVQVPKSRLSLQRVGVMGHSFGGAASAQAMLQDARFAAGINEDGALFGSVATQGLAQPFLILAEENHTLSSDATWAGFWAASRGEKWLLRIKGATHGSFTDYPAILDALGPGVVPPGVREIFGRVEGRRMVDVEVSYVASFFRRFLDGGKGSLLEGGSARFPEVMFDARKGD